MNDAFHSAAGGVEMSFADASKFVDRCLNLIVGHSTRGELAKLGLSAAHAASCEQRQSWTRAVSNRWATSMRAATWGSAPTYFTWYNGCL